MAPKKFSPEFREQVVRAVIDSSRTVADVAREFNVGPETLRNWVNAYRRAHPDVNTLNLGRVALVRGGA